MTALLVFAVLVAALGPLWAYHVGFRRGHASGWLDHYFGAVRQDRERRDRIGRFKAKADTQ
jgi:hypothetical protein